MRVIGIVVVFVGLTLPALAHAADPFADFRIPAHWTRDANGSLDLSGSQNRQGVPLDAIRTYQLGGDASLSFQQLRDSDPLRWLGQVSLATTLAGQHMTEHSIPDPDYTHDQATSQHLYTEMWLVESELRLYPTARPLGFDVGAIASGNYAQQGLLSDGLDMIPTTPVTASQENTNATSHGYSTGVSLSATLGYGRVRDATVVYSVHVLEERLRESGAITRPLSAAAREKLAALFYVAPDLAAVHDRPDRFEWREVENVLREDGALSERGLDAYSVVRGHEPVFGSVTREVGFFVGPSVSATSFHSITRVDVAESRTVTQGGTTLLDLRDSFGTRYVNSMDRVWLGGTAEIHRPVGWAWQLDGLADVSAPARTGERGLQAFAFGDAIWTIADRWSVTGTAQYSRSYFSPRNSDGALATDIWAVGYGVTLGYFLEDHVQLTGSVSGSQQRDNLATTSPSSRFTSVGRFKVGVTYRFLGRFEAPGILEGVRPMY